MKSVDGYKPVIPVINPVFMFVYKALQWTLLRLIYSRLMLPDINIHSEFVTVGIQQMWTSRYVGFDQSSVNLLDRK